MLRRSPLKPGGPLVRRTPLKAKTGLSRKSAPKMAPGRRVPVVVRKTLAERSGGWCEIRLHGCWGRASQVCHRITQKSGGRRGEAADKHDRLSNVLHGCAWCHAKVTTPVPPLDPYGLGISLREWQVPFQVPVLWYRGHAVYLDDAGGVHEYEAVGA